MTEKTNKNNHPIEGLIDWYNSQCNGIWEHNWGFRINTLDNPGISIEINLKDTKLENKPFGKKYDDIEFNCIIDDYESDDNWFICRVENNVFKCSGHQSRFADMLQTFLDWTRDKNENNEGQNKYI